MMTGGGSHFVLCEDYKKIKLVNSRSVSSTTCLRYPGKSETPANKMTERNDRGFFLGAVTLKITLFHLTV